MRIMPLGLNSDSAAMPQHAPGCAAGAAVLLGRSSRWGRRAPRASRRGFRAAVRAYTRWGGSCRTRKLHMH